MLVSVVVQAAGLFMLSFLGGRANAVTGSPAGPTVSATASTVTTTATTAPFGTVPSRVAGAPSAGAALVIGIELTTTVRGSGTLVVTTDVAARVRTLVGALRLGDLRGTRWTATATTQGFRASTSFATPDEATQALRDLGPSFALRLERERSFLTIRNRLSGSVDLRAGWAALSDDLVRQKLGSPLGVDMNELAASLGTRPENVVAITLRADVAGRTRSIPTPFGATTAVAITARQTRTDVVWPLAIAVTAALVIIIRGVARAGLPRVRPRGGSDEEEHDEGQHYDDSQHYDDEYEPYFEEEADGDAWDDERVRGSGRGRGGRR